MSDLPERSKVKIDLSDLFIVLVSLCLTYLVSILTLSSIVFQTSTFSSLSYLKTLEGKFDLDVKSFYQFW